MHYNYLITTHAKDDSEEHVTPYLIKKQRQQLKQQQLCRAPYRTCSKSELPPAQHIFFLGTLLEWFACALILWNNGPNCLRLGICFFPHFLWRQLLCKQVSLYGTLSLRVFMLMFLEINLVCLTFTSLRFSFYYIFLWFWFRPLLYIFFMFFNIFFEIGDELVN